MSIYYNRIAVKINSNYYKKAMLLLTQMFLIINRTPGWIVTEMTQVPSVK